jgi:hypothetical protein
MEGKMTITQLEFDIEIARTREEEERAWDKRIEKNCKKARLMFHLAKELIDEIQIINNKKEK